MNIFNTIKLQAPPHSRFDLSHDVKLTCKMGPLIPVLCHECLPTDRYQVSSEALFRMMPMVFPIMHRIDITFHTWFVPNRILWPNFEKFITGGQTNQIPPAFPKIPIGTVAPSSLLNYMGIPTSTVNKDQVYVNALPFAAYQRIYHEFYRDQNLIQEEPITLVDGDNQPELARLIQLRTRAYEHDYFTSALPFAQKGPPVEMPIGFENATISMTPPGLQNPPGFNPRWVDSNTGLPIVGSPAGSATSHYHGPNNFGSASDIVSGTNVVGTGVTYDPQGSLTITGNVGALLNDLRTAMSLQGWLERNARTGSRFAEYLLGAFGKKSQDARLQRPEYVGGSMSSMSISEVLQTSSSDATTPQGTFAGHGISLNGGASSSYECQEHGYMITMLNIRPKTSYYNGLPRHFDKNDVFDFYDPKFAFLGEQGIKNSELVLSNDPVQNSGIWGYLPRYAEYRTIPSRICGQMATTLEDFHLARKFDDTGGIVPPLNQTFIEQERTKRIFANEDPNEDEIIAQIIFKMSGNRPLPTYGTPMSF